jgi:hypothetical protein
MARVHFLFIGLFLCSLNGIAQDFNIELKKLDGKILLSDFIKNQGYTYLDFKPEVLDTTTSKNTITANSSTNHKVIIRSFSSIIPTTKPLIIINQHYITHWGIFDTIELREVKSIYIHKPSDKIMALYGSVGKFGLIVIEVSKKKLRKLKRAFGRRLGN